MHLQPDAIPRARDVAWMVRFFEPIPLGVPVAFSYFLLQSDIVIGARGPMAVLTSLLGMYRRWLKITPIISGLHGGGKLGILCRPHMYSQVLRYSTVLPWREGPNERVRSFPFEGPDSGRFGGLKYRLHIHRMHVRFARDHSSLREYHRSSTRSTHLLTSKPIGG
jgi:hypothetical protein